MHPNSVNASLEFASITMAESFRVFVHPGTIKHGYLTKSPPLEKKKSSQIVNFKVCGVIEFMNSNIQETRHLRWKVVWDSVYVLGLIFCGAYET